MGTAKDRTERARTKTAQQLDLAKEARRKELLRILTPRLELAQTTDEKRDAIKAIVRGDALGQTSQYFQTGQLRSERKALNDEDARLSTKQRTLKADYETAVAQRTRFNEVKQLWDKAGRFDKLPKGVGSPVQTIVATILVVILEAVLLVPSIERIVRNELPSASDTQVRVYATVAVSAVVLLAAWSVIAFAQAFKEYRTLQKAETLAAEFNEQREEGTPALLAETPDSSSAWLFGILAVALAIGLFGIRALGEGDSSDETSQKILLLVSAVVAILPALLGLIEYRVHDARDLKPGFDQKVIDEYEQLGTSRDQLIPNDRKDLWLQEREAQLAVLSDLLAVAPEVSAELPGLVLDVTKEVETAAMPPGGQAGPA